MLQMYIMSGGAERSINYGTVSDSQCHDCREGRENLDNRYNFPIIFCTSSLEADISMQMISKLYKSIVLKFRLSNYYSHLESRLQYMLLSGRNLIIHFSSF